MASEVDEGEKLTKLMTKNEEVFTEELNQQTDQTTFQLINQWIWWTIFLPITIPLEITKFVVKKTQEWTIYIILLAWSIFCVITLFLGALLVYVPYIGDRLAWLFLLPSKIDKIPEQPLVSFALNILKQSRLRQNEAHDRN